MSSIRLVEPVVRFCAIISRHEEAVRWAVDRIAAAWGPPGMASHSVPFLAGGFYDQTMGTELRKTLLAFGDYQDPGGLADWKRQTNDWELQCKTENEFPESRPINLDAGYLSQAKLVLATIKDRDHRIYLRDGIFAEVTLNYIGKDWIHHRWSYPSYRTPEVAAFAHQCRAALRDHLVETDQIRRVVRE